MSDFKEEKPPHSTNPDLKLKGYNVVLIYMPLAEDAMDPNKLRTRLEQWNKIMSTAGASKITQLLIEGINAAQIVKGLEE